MLMCLVDSRGSSGEHPIGITIPPVIFELLVMTCATQPLPDSSRPEATYACCLEAPSLIGRFLQHPPVGFDVHLSEQGLPYFFTPFDLLTTADDAFVKRVRNWPGYTLWNAWLRIDSCFVGTTVSEYSPFPQAVSPQALAQWLQHECAPQRRLTVIKDVPCNSPLLSDADNRYA